MRRISGLAAAALAMAGLVGVVSPPLTNAAESVRPANTAPERVSSPTGVFKREDEFGEAELMATLANRLGRGGSSEVKTRRSGERAHRRWRFARASGIKGKFRG